MSDSIPYIQYLEQPELILQADKDVFHQWVEKYPYVPIFRVLLVAKYQSEDHIDTAKFLEEAAFYVQDRKQLKHLLRNWNDTFKSFQLTSQAEDTLPIFENSDATSIEENTFIPPLEKADAMDEIVSEEKTEKLLSENEEQELSEILPNGVHTEVENIVEVIEKIEEVEKEETEIPDQNFLENDILPDDENSTPIEENDIYEANTEKVQIEEPISEQVIDEVVTEEIVAPEEIVVIEEIIYSETTIIIEQTEEISEEVVIEAITEDDDIAFLKSIGKFEQIKQSTNEISDWELTAPGKDLPSIQLDDVIDSGLVDTDISWLTPWIDEFQVEFTPSKKADIVIKEITTVEVVTSIVVEETSPKENKDIPKEIETPKAESNAHSFDEWLSILEQKKQQPEEAPVFDLPTPEVFTPAEIQSEAIKNDVESIGTFKEKTDTEGSVKKLAAESVSFKNDMATETLAKLYIRQGKNDLAIGIYKQLMNKFPEKSSYFADQINLLK